MSKALQRVENIKKKVLFIEEIVKETGSITKALEDEKCYRPSILMHLTSIAEQFNKLSKDGEFEILSKFDKRDLKGSYDVRTFIAHDYDGVNLSLIEEVIREKLPKIKKSIEEIL